MEFSALDYHPYFTILKGEKLYIFRINFMTHKLLYTHAKGFQLPKQEHFLPKTAIFPLWKFHVQVIVYGFCPPCLLISAVDPDGRFSFFFQ